MKAETDFDLIEKMMLQDGHYRHTEYCHNCRKENKMQIPMGVTIRSHIQYLKCTYCRCYIKP